MAGTCGGSELFFKACWPTGRAFRGNQKRLAGPGFEPALRGPKCNAHPSKVSPMHCSKKSSTRVPRKPRIMPAPAVPSHRQETPTNPKQGCVSFLWGPKWAKAKKLDRPPIRKAPKDQESGLYWGPTPWSKIESCTLGPPRGSLRPPRLTLQPPAWGAWVLVPVSCHLFLVVCGVFPVRLPVSGGACAYATPKHLKSLRVGAGYLGDIFVKRLRSRAAGPQDPRRRHS